MAKSFIDSNKYSRGIQKALQVRGERQAPDKLDVDAIRLIADAMQGGFSIYDLVGIEIEDNFQGGSTSEAVTILGPNRPAGDQNNREFEHRLLFGMVSITLSNAGIDQWVSAGLRLSIPAIPTVVPIGVFENQVEFVAQPLYRFHFPTGNYFSNKNTANRDTKNGTNTGNWAGWIPAGTDFDVIMERNVNYPAASSYRLEFVFAKVPRGARLPV